MISRSDIPVEKTNERTPFRSYEGWRDPLSWCIVNFGFRKSCHFLFSFISLFENPSMDEYYCVKAEDNDLSVLLVVLRRWYICLNERFLSNNMLHAHSNDFDLICQKFLFSRSKILLQKYLLFCLPFCIIIKNVLYVNKLMSTKRIRVSAVLHYWVSVFACRINLTIALSGPFLPIASIIGSPDTCTLVCWMQNRIGRRGNAHWYAVG